MRRTSLVRSLTIAAVSAAASTSITAVAAEVDYGLDISA